MSKRDRSIIVVRLDPKLHHRFKVKVTKQHRNMNEVAVGLIGGFVKGDIDVPKPGKGKETKA